MIAKIKGKLIEIEGNKGFIETASGLTYEVFLTPSFLKENIQDKIIDIYTHFIVREDTQALYGFINKTELNIFKMLLSISGIGPKVAFGVISFINPENLLTAVKNNDVDFFTKIPGLGRKTALKIILELSNKLDSGFSFSKIYLSEDDKLVMDALVSLGFKSNDVKKIMMDIPKDLSVEERIKKGLKIGTTHKKKI